MVILNTMRFGSHPFSTQNGAYVSPSDAIQSPASQKLAGFKQRQINRK